MAQSVRARARYLNNGKFKRGVSKRNLRRLWAGCSAWKHHQGAAQIPWLSWGTMRPVSTTSGGRPQPWAVGHDPQGIRLEVWEAGWLVLLSSNRITVFLLHTSNPRTLYIFPSPWFSWDTERLQRPLSSWAQRTNFGHFLRLLCSCRDILTPVLILGHPLTRSLVGDQVTDQVTLWTKQPRGVFSEPSRSTAHSRRRVTCLCLGDSGKLWSLTQPRLPGPS